MDIEYQTERTKERTKRVLRIRGWTMSKSTLVRTLVTAAVTVLLPLVIKLLLVLAGQQQLLTLLQK